MRLFASGCRVTEPGEGEMVEEGTRRFRRPVSRRTGAVEIAQTINVYATGRAPARVNPCGDEVHYVAAGQGSALLDNARYALSAGTALYVPAGAVCAIDNDSTADLQIISVSCPEDEQSHRVEEVVEEVVDVVVAAMTIDDPPRRTIHELEARAMASGDREFKLLVDKSFGCERVTQFIGIIPQSFTAQHHHTYEEAIYILEGRGIVHSGDESCSFAPGASIYLPVGAKHCLENPHPEPVKLLGVFYPSGSPAVSYRD